MKKILLAILMAFAPNVLFADARQDQIVATAIEVIKAFDQDYTDDSTTHILTKNFQRKNIKGVAIFPDLVKVALVASSQKGEGIFIARLDDGSWSDPLFVNYNGVGAGAQVGIISQDAVFLFSNQRSYTSLFDDSSTLEFSVGIAGGPFGGEARNAVTDFPRLGANIYAFGRSEGIFAGLNISTAKIVPNDKFNIDYYQRIFKNKDILNGSPRDNKLTKKLKAALENSFNK